MPKAVLTYCGVIAVEVFVRDCGTAGKFFPGTTVQQQGERTSGAVISNRELCSPIVVQWDLEIGAGEHCWQQAKDNGVSKAGSKTANATSFVFASKDEPMQDMLQQATRGRSQEAFRAEFSSVGEFEVSRARPGCLCSEQQAGKRRSRCGNHPLSTCFRNKTFSPRTTECLRNFLSSWSGWSRR